MESLADNDVKKLWLRLISNSTVHGLRLIFSPRLLVFKVLWAFTFVASLSYCILLSYRIFADYSDMRTITTQTISEPKQLPFPSVTVCNQNRFRKSAVDSLANDSFIKTLAVLNQWWQSYSSPSIQSILNDTERSFFLNTDALYKELSSFRFARDSLTSKRRGKRSNFSQSDTKQSHADVSNWFSYLRVFLPIRNIFRSGDASGVVYNGPNYSRLINQLNDKVTIERILKVSHLEDFNDVAVLFTPTVAEMQMLGVRGNDFILQCSFNGQRCSADDFLPTYSDKYGTCYTFNHAQDGTPLLFESQAGSKSGLYVTLNVEPKEYIGLLSQSVGAVVSLQMYNVTPLPAITAISLSTGKQTNLAVSLKKVQRADPAYSSCAGIRASFNFTNRTYSYTQYVCNLVCLQRTLYMECGCVSSMWGSMLGLQSSPCNILNNTAWQCYQNYTALFRTYALPCQADCKSECTLLQYSAVVSQSDWPTFENLPLLEYSLRKENVSLNEILLDYFLRMARLQLANQLSAAVSNSSQSAEGTAQLRAQLERLLNGELDSQVLQSRPTVHDVMKAIRGNFVRLHVYFDTMQFTTVTELPQYSVESVVASFGGILGLCIGASLLSFGEFLEFVVAIGLVLVVRLKSCSLRQPAGNAAS